MSGRGLLADFAEKPLLKRFIDYLKQQGNEFAADPAGYLESSARAALPPDPLGGYNAQGVPQMNPEATKWLADNVGFGAMTVYHGSPHVFDKFDMSKIGTGEGAQMYGHGLYFAENPKVAANYKNVLSDTVEVSGDATALEKRAAQMALTFGDNTADGAINWLTKHELNGARHTTPALTPELVASVREKFKSGAFKPGGALYKADIPDEAVERMLDWDAPLNKQPQGVLDAMGWNRHTKSEIDDMFDDLLRKYGPADARTPQQQQAFSVEVKKLEELLDRRAPENMTGADLYRGIDEDNAIFGYMSTTNDAANRSADLQAMGIPGIKYFDGQSRAGAKGTRNFVLFDDRLPRILERNGVPTGNQPWKPGEMKGLLGYR